MEGRIARSLATRQVHTFRGRLRLPDGSACWIEGRAVPILNDAGEIVEWFGGATDVTERHQADEHRQLLVQELDHRIRNTLAIVQSIAVQTFRDSADIAEARQRFTDRLLALAQANALLTGQRWASVSLAQSLDQALGPHRPDGDRCGILGPPVELPARTALMLSLAVHELATNATKYGAWSVPGGRVDLAWKVATGGQGERLLELEWRESGGPPVTPPRRRGFGSRLVQRGLPAEMDGEVDLRFEPGGLVCAVRARLPAPPEPEARAAETGAPEKSASETRSGER